MNQSLIVKLLLIISLVSIPTDAFAIAYKKLQNGWFSSVHVLTVDPKEYIMFPVKASGEEIARETVASLAKKHQACAAVNGGFWKLNGDPAGILKINHQWFGFSDKPRGAIGWSMGGQSVIMDRVLASRNENCELTTDKQIAEEWQELEHIVGGTPLLIKNGALIEDYSPEQTLKSFIANRHPRTAVGVKANGEWVFVVVDGKFLGFLGGMSIKKLAQFMLNLGCVHALNLDGGGSSTMVLEGRVVNRPSGKLRERGKRVEAVSDAILIAPRVGGKEFNSERSYKTIFGNGQKIDRKKT